MAKATNSAIEATFLRSLAPGLLVLGASFATGCAAPSSESATTDDALVRGQRVAAGELRSVVELGNSDDSFCTAVKVADRHVLTAAHCVVIDPSERAARCARGDDDEVPATCERNASFRRKGIRLRVRSAERDRWIDAKVASVFVPKAVLDGCRTSACFWDLPGHSRVPDIAVVELEDSIPDAESATVDLRKIEPGTAITTLGYGCTRSGPRWIGDDELRSATSEVVSLRSIGSREIEDFDDALRGGLMASYFFSPASAVGEASLCPGDSGGPLLRPTGEVIGVNAYYLNASHGTTMRANMFTRLDPGAAHDITAWLKRRLPATTFRE